MKEFSAETGEVLVDESIHIADAGNMVGADQYIPALSIDQLVASLTNPRKNFDAAKLAELADSIKSSGLHSPILVRPLPGSRLEETSWNSEPRQQLTRRAVRPTHEIVAGERRYRACKLAGLATLPVLVRHLSDNQVLEVQIIENLQRTDLSALEEAEGYEQLCTATGIKKEDVGAKIGKSRSYVYARLKLLDLSQDCKEALRTGAIDASRALLIARIPDTALQQKALVFATEKAGFEGEIPSVRLLQTWLQRNVMLRLEGAPFNITDTRLVAVAGSCKVCPKRTGANPDLFADVDGADICTDPTCFNGKTEVHRTALIARAESKGMRVIDGAEAKKLFNWRGDLQDYSPLSQVREDVAQGESKTLAKLLGKDAPAPVLIENPITKELIEAVPTDEAEAMLLARGLIKAVEHDGKQSNFENALDNLRSQVERDTNKAVRKALYDATALAVHGTSDAMALQLFTSSIFLRAWLTTMLDELDTDTVASALGYTFAENEDEVDGLTMAIKACSKAGLYRAAVILMSWEEQYGAFTDIVPVLLNSLVEVLDVPAKVLTKTASNQIKAEYAGRLGDLKAKINAQKVPAPLVSAAQAKGAGEKVTKTERPAALASTAPVRKRKLSADEAQAAIAAAMQDSDTDPGIATALQGIEQAATARPEVPADDEGGDALYGRALAVIMREGKANVRLLKTELGIGTTKALQLMSQLEAAGKVSACDQRGSRTVLKVAA